MSRKLPVLIPDDGLEDVVGGRRGVGDPRPPDDLGGFPPGFLGGSMYPRAHTPVSRAVRDFYHQRRALCGDASAPANASARACIDANRMQLLYPYDFDPRSIRWPWGQGR